MDSKVTFFFKAIFVTALLPFLPYLFPFIPNLILGFNITGWSWIIMVNVSIIYLTKIERVYFPLSLWLPWIIYLLGYIILKFSFLGLQLTLQYILPIFIGVIVSSFKYNKTLLNWLFLMFLRLCGTVIFMFVIGYLFRGGSTPAASATPMLLSIAASFFIGIFYFTKKIKYLVLFGLILLVPVIDVTRMGIAAFLVIFVFHFANKRILSKMIYGFVGLIVVILVFNSKKFQEKSFFDGQGKLSDMSINYYDNNNINSNGRSSWKMVLEPGLKEYPIWGNGPRADVSVLSIIMETKSAEAHNDYLSVRYNYGYVGLFLLLFGFCTTFVDMIFKVRKRNNFYLNLIGTSTITLFLSFLMFMYSDNILKYTIFFPNFFFALIGIYYNLFNITLVKRSRL